MDIEIYPIWTSEFANVFNVELNTERYHLIIQAKRVIFTVAKSGNFIDWTFQTVAMRKDCGMIFLIRHE